MFILWRKANLILLIIAYTKAAVRRNKKSKNIFMSEKSIRY